MTVEEPVRVAIIGAGPLGIEAALYARYLGYDVQLLERDQVGGRLNTESQQTLSTPAGQNRTSLGVAALEAQDPNFQAPDPTASETAAEFMNQYLVPLSQSDLLVNRVKLQHDVLQIERTEFSSGNEESNEEAETTELSEEFASEEDEYEIEYAPFLITVRLPDGSQSTLEAETIIDASGWGSEENSAARRFKLIPSGLSNPLLSVDHPGERFMTEEPRLFRLGLPAPGESHVTIPAGHDQIRLIFSVIGERESLNLYETFRKS